MAIDPLGQGSTHHAAQRAGEAARSQEPAPVNTPAVDGGTGDQLLLSSTATDASAEVDVPAGTLSADALRVITERLASGHYDSEAVADRVAGKLIAGGEI
jgi:limonene-1,2-epoxide hydrolase